MSVISDRHAYCSHGRLQNTRRQDVDRKGTPLLRLSQIICVRLVALGILTAPLLLWPSPPHVLATTAGADGKIAFQSQRDGPTQIYVMNNDGSGVTRITNDASDDEAPSWSPDATRIVFDSNRGGNYDVYVMNADGTGQTRLTTDPAVDQAPAWSPDGSKIAFHRGTGGYQVFLMNADGTGQAQLTNESASGLFPDWSPDGHRIAYQCGGAICVINSDGSNRTMLTPDLGHDGRPTWSPDGSRIVFSTNRDGNYEIYVMNSDGSAQTRLTTNPAMDAFPAWSPNGSKIAFTTTRDGNYEVYVMKADGTGQTNMTNNPAYDDYARWQPLALGDTDGDGCTDARELGPDWHTGGQRDPNNPWDFFDVPLPVNTDPTPNGPKNKAVNISDVLAVVAYIGTFDGGPPNANGVRYDSLKDGDWFNTGTGMFGPDGGIGPDDKVGRQYDRTPSSDMSKPWQSGPPNGAVSIQDALVALNQVGSNCN